MSIMFSATTIGRPSSMSWRDEVEVALQVAGIDDDDDHVGRGGVGAQAAEDLHGHDLIGRAADEAVGAGQVDDLGPAPPGSWHRPVFFSTVTPG